MMEILTILLLAFALAFAIIGTHTEAPKYIGTGLILLVVCMLLRFLYALVETVKAF